MTDNKSPKRVLAIIADGVEELELIAVVDVLRRGAIDVVLATTQNDLLVTSKQGLKIHAEQQLSEINPADFDLLYLPGGPQVITLRQEPAIAPLISSFLDRQQPVAAICAAPLLLKDAGLLGQNYTCHHSVAAELPDSQPEQAVVVDGLIHTSRGPGSALQFGLHLLSILSSPDEATRIAQDIMA